MISVEKIPIDPAGVEGAKLYRVLIDGKQTHEGGLIPSLLIAIAMANGVSVEI